MPISANDLEEGIRVEWETIVSGQPIILSGEVSGYRVDGMTTGHFPHQDHKDSNMVFVRIDTHGTPPEIVNATLFLNSVRLALE